MDIRHGVRRLAPDVVLAVAVAGFVLAGVTIGPPGRTDLDPLGFVLLLAGPAALAACRHAPVPVLLVTTVCVLGYLLRGYPGVVAALPVMVALLIAVRSGHRLITLAPVVAIVVVVVGDLTITDGRDFRQVIEDRFLLCGWLVASAVLGETFRQWAAYTEQVEERAADAERTREETALRRAGEERLRIARELHDSLTHSISIIKVQAGVAIHLARKRGQEVPEALVAVQEAGTEAMRELRATLEMLRDIDLETPPEAGAGSPDTCCDRLADLIPRTRAAGLPTTLTITGDRRELAPDVDRAVYRIVQEALTNVGKHAGEAHASVHIDYGTQELTVRVDDDGGAPPDAGQVPGVGLRGMRERITALGGRLEAMPRPEGGFTVRAELPVRDASSERTTDHHGLADHEVKQQA
jgi:signal transduction histidine kinase